MMAILLNTNTNNISLIAEKETARKLIFYAT